MAKQIIYDYKLLVPPKLSKKEYESLRSQIPKYLKIDVYKDLFEEWNPVVILLCIVLFPIGLITGILPSVANYYGYLIRKQNYYDKLYKAIYQSKNYEEYSLIWDRIEPKENYQNRVQQHMEKLSQEKEWENFQRDAAMRKKMAEINGVLKKGKK